jgi:hypothetical protein
VRLSFSWIVLVVVTFVASGCGGGSGASSPPATAAPTATPPATATPALNIGAEQQLLTSGQLDVMNVPDDHFSFVQSGGAYHAWVAGNIAGSPGSAALLTTSDFTTFSGVGGANGNAAPVFGASGSGTTAFDADYAAPGTVFTAANGTDLLMIYHGENHLFNGVVARTVPFYATVGLARSSDGGLTWTRQGAIIRGADPQPNPAPTALGFGALTPSTIVANGYLYTYYTYDPVPGSADAGPGLIHVSRATVASDGAPGSWMTYDAGTFSQPALGGAGSGVVPNGTGIPCTAPQRHAGISYNTYLKRYLLTYLCNEGWFYSTSLDLTTWTNPTQFETAPVPNNQLQPGSELDWFPTLVTIGTQNGMTTGQTGYVFYAKGQNMLSPHNLWRRSFAFGEAAP